MNKIERIRHMNLKNKLLLAFLFIGIIPSLVLGYLLYSKTEDHFLNIMKNQSVKELTRLSKQIDIIDDNIDGIANIIKVQLESANIDNNNLEKVEEILHRIEESFYPIDKIIIDYNNIGNLTYNVSLKSDNIQSIKENIFEREFIFNINGIKVNLKLIYSNEGLRKVLGLDDNEKNKLIFLGECSELSIKKESQNIVKDLNGDRYLFTHVNNEKMGICICSFIDINYILSYSNEIGSIFIKTSLIIIVLAICFSLSISYNIIYGINKLINYIKNVEKGNFEFKREELGDDEIGILAKSFYNMTSRLNELINKTYRLRIKEREAQLKALQAQISPHFLYNALDTINWSLIENGDFETSETLCALSSILRYSIDGTGSMVKIKDELDQLKNYLFVQKSRFEDRFRYTIECSEELYNIKIPKLLVQPIVENAVSHGIEKRTSEGVINIEIMKKDNMIAISVKDNGYGISEKKLLELKKQILDRDKFKDEDDRYHLGLANVNQRIQIIYGKDYGIEIYSENEDGVEVIIKLPINGEINNENFSGR
ncbi:sensor histidine kinase [Clostridioides difficile]